MPPGILGPRDGYVAVDLVEPGCSLLDLFNPVSQTQVFKETVPWIVIRIGDGPPNVSSSRAHCPGTVVVPSVLSEHAQLPVFTTNLFLQTIVVGDAALRCDRFRIGMNHSFTLNLSRLINNADRC